VLGDRSITPFVQLSGVVDDTTPELQERCFKGTGVRKELLFDTYIANMGPGILNITDPSAHPTVWTQSALGQTLFEGWSRFTLKDADGAVVATGHKGSFCMTDFTPPVIDGAPQFLPGCGGLDVGYYDIYSNGLACQFVDVTDVPPGQYVLTIEANVFHDIPENNYGNNTDDIAVTIP